MLIIVLCVLSIVASCEAGYTFGWLMVPKVVCLVMAAETVGSEGIYTKSNKSGTGNF
jgi:hypothetical protein